MEGVSLNQNQVAFWQKERGVYGRKEKGQKREYRKKVKFAEQFVFFILPEHLSEKIDESNNLLTQEKK